MSAEDITRALYAAIEAQDWDAMASYLSDDMEFSGPTPEPISGEQWVGLHRTMAVAFPDFSFNLSDVQVTGNVAHTTHQITGTHKGDLDLSAMGLPVVPATGKAVKLAVEHANFTVEGGKVIRVHADVPAGGGVSGLMQQLGVEMSPPPE